MSDILRPADLSKDELVRLVENIMVSIYGTTDNDGGVVLDEEKELDIESAFDVADDLEEAGLAPEGVVGFEFSKPPTPGDEFIAEMVRRGMKTAKSTDVLR